MKLLMSLFVLVFSFSANAALITLSEDKAGFNGFQLPSTGTVNVNGADVTLTTITGGMRKKYLVPFFGTDIYVTQIMVADKNTVVKSAVGNEFLDSLATTQSVAAVKLNFEHNVDAGTIYLAFSDALTVNGVDIVSPEISQFLEIVKNGGDVAKGQSMTFLLVKNVDGSETATYENPAGVPSAPVAGAPGLGRNILSIWLGKISVNDKGLLELKNQLVK
jgi:hypothetical protein